MDLSAPKKITWLISLIVGIIGFIAKLITIPVLTPIAFWLEVVALALLLIATFMPGL